MALSAYGDPVPFGDTAAVQQQIRLILEMFTAAFEQGGLESIAIQAVRRKKDDKVETVSRFFVQARHMDFIQDAEKAMFEYLEKNYKVTVEQLRADRAQAQRKLDAEIAARAGTKPS